MNQLTVSSDRSVLNLGPGLRWGDVYNALDAYGVSVIGGRIPHVGVAGLILGGCSSLEHHVIQRANKDASGGYFHFSGEYGLAADNVKNFEVSLSQYLDLSFTEILMSGCPS